MQYDAILERPAFACRPQPNATLHAHKSHLPVECDGMSLCVLQVLRVLSGIPEVGAHAEQLLTGFALRSDAMHHLLVIDLHQGFCDHKDRHAIRIANHTLVLEA